MTRSLALSACAGGFALAALSLATLAAPARADEPGVELVLGGGSVVAWGASSETGNAFGGLALVDIDDFSVGLGIAAVMPDSRLQGEFGAYWAEGRWAFLGQHLFEPYACIGLGFATDDGFKQAGAAFVPARWSTTSNFLGMVGAGLRFGNRDGLSVSADVRAWNTTHLGLQLMAGFRFF